MDINIDSSRLSQSSDNHFASGFPLPYRVLFLVGTGILAWALNLHILHLLGVDSISALDVRRSVAQETNHTPLPSTARQSSSTTYHVHPAGLYRPLYRLFIQYSAWCTVSWLLFHWCTTNDARAINEFKLLPIVTATVVLLVLISPFNHFQKGLRTIFRQYVSSIWCRMAE